MRVDEVKVGLPVLYWGWMDGDAKGDGKFTVITSEIRYGYRNEAVCDVDGISGYVDIRHLELATAELRLKNLNFPIISAKFDKACSEAWREGGDVKSYEAINECSNLSQETAELLMKRLGERVPDGKEITGVAMVGFGDDVKAQVAKATDVFMSSLQACNEPYLDKTLRGIFQSVAAALVLDIFNEKERLKLQHYYDSTQGLWAMDFNPTELLERFEEYPGDDWAEFIDSVAFQLGEDGRVVVSGEDIEAYGRAMCEDVRREFLTKGFSDLLFSHYEVREGEHYLCYIETCDRGEAVRVRVDMDKVLKWKSDALSRG